MRIDELDDLLDPFGNRSCFNVQVTRPRDGDVRYGLVDLEELQALPRELPAQDVHDLDRKAHLLVIVSAQQTLQGAMLQVNGRSPWQGVGIDRLDDVRQMRFAEMSLHFIAAV